MQKKGKWNEFLKISNISKFCEFFLKLSYGIIYGMGATALGKELNMQKEHAQQMIRSFFQQFPSKLFQFLFFIF